MNKKRQVAEYITELGCELAKIANANGFATLEHILRMAAMEAKSESAPPKSVRANQQGKMKAAA